MSETILEIDKLTSGYQVKQGRVEAVKEVSFSLAQENSWVLLVNQVAENQLWPIAF